jgi:hypothetical protein
VFLTKKEEKKKVKGMIAKGGGKRRKKTGHVYARILTLVCILAVLAIITMCWIYPELLHPCNWPWEDVYGSYDHLLMILVGLQSALQFASLLLVILWFLQQKYRPKEEDNLEIINIWNCLGIKKYQVPFCLYLFQAVAVVLDMWILAYHQTPLMVLSILSFVASMLVLMQGILSPSGLCCLKTHQPEDACHRFILTRDNFLGRMRSIALFSFAIILLFLVMYGMQYGETFGTSSSFFTKEQLSILSDASHPFNQHLLFPHLSRDLLKRNAHGELPSQRVVLIVIDGMRDDFVEKNPDFLQLVQDKKLIRLHGKAALPTMSVPNWLTLLSGVPPELTGFHGNLFTGETPFDTFFVRSRRADTLEKEFMTGMTGCPWWSTMQTSQFPRLKGDGTLAAYSMYDLGRRNIPLPLDFLLPSSLSNLEQNFGVAQKEGEPSAAEPSAAELSAADVREKNVWHSDEETDQKRTRVACEALQDTHDPYRFFLIHFSNPDTQAHSIGVSPLYNTGDTYNKAISETTKNIKKILEVLEGHPWRKGTWVIITSDHGEVDAGGHGGISSDVQNIPILLRSFEGDWEDDILEKDFGGALENIEDVATTVSVLLGLPIPRQSHGKLLSPVSERLSKNVNVSRDLYETLREWFNVFLIEARMTAYEWCSLQEDFPFLSRYPLKNESISSEEYLESYQKLKRLYSEERERIQTTITIRNILLSLLWMFFLMYATAIFFVRRSFWGLSLCGSPSDPESVKRQGKLNCCFLWLGLFITCLYLLVVMGTVLLTYHLLGYQEWDSTMIHSVQASLKFGWIALLPGILFMFLLNRIYQAAFVKFWQQGNCLGCLANCMRWFCIETTFVNGYSQNVATLTLLRMWLLYWSLLLWSLLLVFQGVYSFLLPFVYTNWIITETTWTWRFRVNSTQLMVIPLLIGNLISICLYSSSTIKNDHSLDTLRGISKDIQANRDYHFGKQPRTREDELEIEGTPFVDQINDLPGEKVIEQAIGEDGAMWSLF